jgi:hypothetical protein
VNIVVAGGLLDENVAIDRLQHQFGVIRHLHVEIEDDAIPVVAVAAIMGAAGSAVTAGFSGSFRGGRWNGRNRRHLLGSGSVRPSTLPKHVSGALA